MVGPTDVNSNTTPAASYSFSFQDDSGKEINIKSRESILIAARDDNASTDSISNTPETKEAQGQTPTPSSPSSAQTTNISPTQRGAVGKCLKRLGSGFLKGTGAVLYLPTFAVGALGGGLISLIPGVKEEFASRPNIIGIKQIADHIHNKHDLISGFDRLEFSYLAGVELANLLPSLVNKMLGSSKPKI